MVKNRVEIRLPKPLFQKSSDAKLKILRGLRNLQFQSAFILQRSIFCRTHQQIMSGRLNLRFLPILSVVYESTFSVQTQSKEMHTGVHADDGMYTFLFALRQRICLNLLPKAMTKTQKEQRIMQSWVKMSKTSEKIIDADPIAKLSLERRKLDG